MTRKHGAADAAAAAVTAAADARNAALRQGGSQQPGAPRQAGGPQQVIPPMPRRKLSMFDRALLGPALVDAFRKLSPRVQWRNPVMFVVYIGSILTTALWIQALGGAGEAP
ncbi:MAG TPA: hypothetical protein VGO18_16815, partial [Steroidobacteraceae bacterium]|nr:hypothetical protein [Steroidobacteraceae bacterium]